MTYKVLLMVSAVLIFFSLSAFAQGHKPPKLKFSDLQKYDPANGTFRIEGYVIDIYKCPPCPPGAMCKPCIPNNVTLVDQSDWKDMSVLKRLRIYTDLTDKFEVKKKYLLTVKVVGNVKAGDPVDSVELVSIAQNR